MADPRVVAWYDEKTQFLLDKYGPGPRIHYHTGLVDPSVQPAADFEGLRQQLWASQEAMLQRASVLWDGQNTLSGDVIDVGCGLGGGPIFWAQHTGARVVGLTPVPSHVPIVDRLAAEAGVGHLVRAELGDAHEVPGEGRFDAAVTMGATTYFDRPRWFQRLAGLLRPGGSVFIEDTFVGRPDMREPFNRYWISGIGAFPEYIEAAAAAGFELVHREDVTLAAAGFWRISGAWSEQLLVADKPEGTELKKRLRSIEWQGEVYDAYLNGGFQNLLVQFRRIR